MADDDRPRLCVFTRAPVAGEVKRRLARRMGPELALAAHEALVVDTLERLRACRGLAAELWLAGEPNDTVRAWTRRYHLELYHQHGTSLGARMRHALQDALRRGRRAVLMGTDCPAVDADYVAEALLLLAEHDVVMGPAQDGGYGLIGANADCAQRLDELFEGVRWGTSGVASATRRRAAAAGWRLAELPLIWDVDTYADWQRYVALRSASDDSSPGVD